jgi:hypothetical protein
MIELHFSDLPVPAIIFVCGAWITINQTMKDGFSFIFGAFIVYVIFIIILMMLRGEIK